MLSRNDDSELTANVRSDRQRNFGRIPTFCYVSAYEALQRAGLINPDWLIRPPSIITRARARGLRGFAGLSNGVKNSRPLKQKADCEVTA
ncbi:hypothetical protein ALC62_04297 [Cyphomyrmex costatus]|uniref:Uncharacterized protein n=1 Tax=Cyphomyrmex costatus TaxID=456900 RepID=A0A195CWK0_9HYME|nr:hypothetical protein ALC62_04297 [Cyphomyrmex costatus]